MIRVAFLTPPIHSVFAEAFNGFGTLWIPTCARPRLVRFSEKTVIMNAIRSRVGGDLENFPRWAWTLGMKQCLSARRIQLYCRNDIDGLDWANTVLRLAVLGHPGDDYPVTWIREHGDWQIVTDRKTADPPPHAL